MNNDNQTATKKHKRTFFIARVLAKIFFKRDTPFDASTDTVKTSTQEDYDKAFGVNPSLVVQAANGGVNTKKGYAHNVDADRQLLAQLASEMLAEQRAKRRWSVVFRTTGWLVFIFLLYQLFLANNWRDAVFLSGGPVFQNIENDLHVGVVSIKGVISEDGDTDAYNTIVNLNAAVSDDKTLGVLLDINSPGGTPAQSAAIYREVLRLRALYPETPIHAVISDIGTSGAYYVASAAQKIFSDPTSLVGSIGVIQTGFGFHQALEKIGVERRVITAGQEKSQLDPYLPQDPQQVAYWKNVLGRVHQQFISDVVVARPQLAEKHHLLGGQIFDGVRALEQGFIDATGDILSVARQEFDNENLVFFENERQKIFALIERLGANMLRKVMMQMQALLQNPSYQVQ